MASSSYGVPPSHRAFLEPGIESRRPSFSRHCCPRPTAAVPPVSEDWHKSQRAVPARRTLSTPRPDRASPSTLPFSSISTCSYHRLAADTHPDKASMRIASAVELRWRANAASGWCRLIVSARQPSKPSLTGLEPPRCRAITDGWRPIAACPTTMCSTAMARSMTVPTVPPVSWRHLRSIVWTPERVAMRNLPAIACAHLRRYLRRRDWNRRRHTPTSFFDMLGIGTHT